LFFRAPRGWVAPTNRTPIGVDIRGQGGFAMLPPSLHSSGRQYHWEAGRAPWEVDLAKAPQWLLDAVDALVEQHGGHKPELEEGAVRTPQPATDHDWFGKRVDGREDDMTRRVWAGVMTMKRAGDEPGQPNERNHFEAALMDYLRHTRTRLKGVDNVEGLEREGRGPSLFLTKWQRAMRKWGTEAFEREAAKPPPKPENKALLISGTIPGTGTGSEQTAEGIRVFDFARLILETVEEQPALIEPDLLDFGGFLLIGGPPKAQKSWLLQDMLVSCAIGVPFLGEMFRVERPLKVFWLQAEMNEKLLRRRAKAVQGLTDGQMDMLASNLIVSDRFRMVLGEDGVRLAADLIKASFHDGPPDIIAFDPLANIYDQENENDNAQMMRFLTQRLEAVRQLVNPVAGVILVHHATKKSPQEIAKDPFNCFRGGGALRGHYDSGIIIFKKSEEGDERELHFELRGGESPEPKTAKLEQGRMQPVKESNFFRDDKNGWPDRDVCRQILYAMQEGWMKGGKACWSNQHNTGARYAAKIMHVRWGIKEKMAKEMLLHWEINKLVEYQEKEPKNHLWGLNVIGQIP
jgi:hypothetical protein